MLDSEIDITNVSIIKMLLPIMSWLYIFISFSPLNTNAINAKKINTGKRSLTNRIWCKPNPK